jgi:hypothetical protein
VNNISAAAAPPVQNKPIEVKTVPDNDVPVQADVTTNVTTEEIQRPDGTIVTKKKTTTTEKSRGWFRSDKKKQVPVKKKKEENASAGDGSWTAPAPRPVRIVQPQQTIPEPQKKAPEFQQIKLRSATAETPDDEDAQETAPPPGPATTTTTTKTITHKPKEVKMSTPEYEIKEYKVGCFCEIL